VKKSLHRPGLTNLTLEVLQTQYKGYGLLLGMEVWYRRVTG